MVSSAVAAAVEPEPAVVWRPRMQVAVEQEVVEGVSAQGVSWEGKVEPGRPPVRQTT